jgi:hypothetical protein
MDVLLQLAIGMHDTIALFESPGPALSLPG